MEYYVLFCGGAMANELLPATRENIKILLDAHGIDRAGVAALLSVSIHTVDSWTAPDESPKNRKMPVSSWEMLMLKLNAHPFKILVDRI
jgi:hypothetical protein